MSTLPPETIRAITDLLRANGFRCTDKQHEDYCPSHIELFMEGVQLARIAIGDPGKTTNPGRLPNITAIGWLSMGLPLYCLTSTSNASLPILHFFTCKRAGAAYYKVNIGGHSYSVPEPILVRPETIPGMTSFISLKLLATPQANAPATGEAVANLVL